MAYRSGELDQQIEKRKKMQNQPAAIDEPDEVELLAEREISLPLNRRKSVFGAGDGAGANGVNAQLSVFDRGAVFRTGGEND